jgi:hypothetical protein
MELVGTKTHVDQRLEDILISQQGHHLHVELDRKPRHTPSIYNLLGQRISQGESEPHDEGFASSFFIPNHGKHMLIYTDGNNQFSFFYDSKNSTHQIKTRTDNTPGKKKSEGDVRVVVSVASNVDEYPTLFTAAKTEIMHIGEERVLDVQLSDRYYQTGNVEFFIQNEDDYYIRDGIITGIRTDEDSVMFRAGPKSTIIPNVPLFQTTKDKNNYYEKAIPYLITITHHAYKPWEHAYDTLGLPFMLNEIYVRLEKKENYHHTITPITKAIPVPEVKT